MTTDSFPEPRRADFARASTPVALVLLVRTRTQEGRPPPFFFVDGQTSEPSHVFFFVFTLAIIIC